MSPNINSFVGDLVAMAQAMEELPKAQDRIADLERQLADAQRHNQGLEQNILGYKADIDGLQSKLAAETSARENAELHTMEMEDRFSSVSRFLGSLMGEANTLRNAIDPPKPEPTSTPIPPTDSAPDNMDASTQYPIEAPRDSGTHVVGTATDVTGQSEANPSQTNGGQSSTTDMGNGGFPNVGPDSPPAPTTSSSALPYAGLIYEDYPSWVSRADWLAGGGTDWSYDYRKPHTLY